MAAVIDQRAQLVAQGRRAPPEARELGAVARLAHDVAVERQPGGDLVEHAVELVVAREPRAAPKAVGDRHAHFVGAGTRHR